jgi:hypothetical protein
MTCKNKKHKDPQCACAQLTVDYPRQGEKITGVSYTFRISAPANVQKVEVAIDQADWQPCRVSEGYWWSDWSGYENGEHEITARIVTAEGKSVVAEPHEFFVQLEKQLA